jgi:folate-dependent phosphoribosylglycinamide formyltransferase PurN
MRTHHNNTIAVWGSGRGSTFRTIAQQLHEGVIGGFEIGLVISDNKSAGILDEARHANKFWGMDIRTETVEVGNYPGGRKGPGITDEQSQRVCELMSGNGTRNLALLGCMAILRGVVLQMYGWEQQLADNDPKNKGIYESFIQNTHPGLLPDTAGTYGVGSSRRVYELGLPQTAHTFHAVGEEVDAGPIIAEHRIDVPGFNTIEPPRMDAAAKHLFTLVQAVEKANLGVDMERYYGDQLQRLPY